MEMETRNKIEALKEIKIEISNNRPKIQVY
jgi:hypothetical protein